VEDGLKHAKEEAEKKLATEPALTGGSRLFIRATEYKKASGLTLHTS